MGINVRLEALLAIEAYTEVCQYVHEHMALEDLQEQFLCDLLLKIESTPRTHRIHGIGQEIMRRILHNSIMLKVIPEIMQRHFGNVCIQQKGCEFIDYAFRTNGFLDNMPQEITPCATVALSAIEEYVDFPGVQYHGCRALHAVLKTGSTHGRFPFVGTAGQHLLATLVHKTMFTAQVPTLQENMSESCCVLLATLVPGWKFEEHKGDMGGKSAAGIDISVDRAIAAAMADFPENREISLHGARALGVLALTNLQFFTDVPRSVINIVNVFQMEYMYTDYQEAAASALTNFARNHASGNIIKVNQECIGRTGVISLVLCALRNHFESNSVKSEIVKVMCALLDLLHALGSECESNQERILFTQSPSLLLGIAKMRQRSTNTHMETTTLRLLCMLVLNQSNGRCIDASWPYDLATWNKKIAGTQGANLMDMTVQAMGKSHADHLLLLDGLRMLCACVGELTKDTRNQNADARLLSVVKDLMVTSGTQSSDDITRLAVVLLEMLSHHAAFAKNPDMLKALGIPTPPSLRNDLRHCSVRKNAIQQIAAHMTS